MMTEIDPEAVTKLLELELPPDNDAHVPTARAWLAELLKVAWRAKDDAFKRPFGFSGPWWDELYAAMVRSGLAEGEFEDGGDCLDFVGAGADALILAAIDAMGQPQDSAGASTADLLTTWAGVRPGDMVLYESGLTLVDTTGVLPQIGSPEILIAYIGGRPLRFDGKPGDPVNFSRNAAGLTAVRRAKAITAEDAMLRRVDDLNGLVRDMLQSFPDTADEQEWRDRAGALSVCDPDGQPYRAHTEDVDL